MTYEEKIAKFGNYDVIIRTEANFCDVEKFNDLKIIAERLKKILSDIELHTDYEDLLYAQEQLLKASQILIDWQANDCNKQAKLEAEINGEKIRDLTKAEQIAWIKQQKEQER